jgi:hypothetical protein
MKGGIKAASNSIVVFYFNRQQLQKISTSTKIDRYTLFCHTFFFSFPFFSLCVLTNKHADPNKPVNPNKLCTNYGIDTLVIIKNVSVDSVDFHYSLCNFEFLKNECSISSALKSYLVLLFLVVK